jgi:hypothetical protein
VGPLATLQEVRDIFDRHGVSWARYQTFTTEWVERDARCSTLNPMFAEVEMQLDISFPESWFAQLDKAALNPMSLNTFRVGT